MFPVGLWLDLWVLLLRWDVVCSFKSTIDGNRLTKQRYIDIGCVFTKSLSGSLTSATFLHATSFGRLQLEFSASTTKKKRTTLLSWMIWYSGEKCYSSCTTVPQHIVCASKLIMSVSAETESTQAILFVTIFLLRTTTQYGLVFLYRWNFLPRTIGGRGTFLYRPHSCWSLLLYLT